MLNPFKYGAAISSNLYRLIGVFAIGAGTNFRIRVPSTPSILNRVNATVDNVGLFKASKGGNRAASGNNELPGANNVTRLSSVLKISRSILLIEENKNASAVVSNSRMPSSRRLATLGDRAGPRPLPADTEVDPYPKTMTNAISIAEVNFILLRSLKCYSQLNFVKFSSYIYQ